MKLVAYKKIFNTIRNKKDGEKHLKFARILDSMRKASPIVDSLYSKIEKKVRTSPRIIIQHLTRADSMSSPPPPDWNENVGVTNYNSNGVASINLGQQASVEVFIEELTHGLQYIERNTTIPPDNDELVHLEFEAKVINHLIFGVDNGTALFKQETSGRINYKKSYTDWIKDIKLENLSNFGSGEFHWSYFNRYIEYFATFPYPTYNALFNPDFGVTRQPTILFLLFR